MTAMELVHSSRDNLVGGENLEIKQLGTEKLSDTIHDVEGKVVLYRLLCRLCKCTSCTSCNRRSYAAACLTALLCNIECCITPALSTLTDCQYSTE